MGPADEAVVVFPVMKHLLVACLLTFGLVSVLPTGSAQVLPGGEAGLDHCEDIPPTTYDCIMAYVVWVFTFHGNGAINYVCRNLRGQECIH